MLQSKNPFVPSVLVRDLCTVQPCLGESNQAVQLHVPPLQEKVTGS